MKNTNLLNSVFDSDRIKIKRMCVVYFLIIAAIFVAFIILVFTVKKDNYYENYIIKENDNIIIIIDKSKINLIQNKGIIIIDGIKNNYSISKVHNDSNGCIIYLNLDNIIENINHQKCQILLGKETIIEYIIRVILG